MDTWGDEWVTEVIGLRQNGRMGLASQVDNADQSLRA